MTGIKDTDTLKRPLSTKDGGSTLMKRRNDQREGALRSSMKKEMDNIGEDEEKRNEYF